MLKFRHIHFFEIEAHFRKPEHGIARFGSLFNAYCYHRLAGNIPVACEKFMIGLVIANEILCQCK